MASQIENYLKRMLSLSDDNMIEVRRSDLADIFQCVPSQINYVLETRFNPEAGYYIETRRGGAGYIEIMKLDFDNDENLAALLNESKAKPISQKNAENMFQRLQSEDLLTVREVEILKGLMDRDRLGLPEEEANYMRGRIIRWVLIVLLRDDFE